MSEVEGITPKDYAAESARVAQFNLQNPAGTPVTAVRSDGTTCQGTISRPAWLSTEGEALVLVDAEAATILFGIDRVTRTP